MKCIIKYIQNGFHKYQASFPGYMSTTCNFVKIGLNQLKTRIQLVHCIYRQILHLYLEKPLRFR